MSTTPTPTPADSDATLPPKCRRLLGIVATDTGVRLLLCGARPPPALLQPHCHVFHPPRARPAAGLLRSARAREVSPAQWAAVCARAAGGRWSEGAQWTPAHEARFQARRAAALDALRADADFVALAIDSDALAQVPALVLPSFDALFDALPEEQKALPEVPEAPPLPLQTFVAPDGAEAHALCAQFGTPCFFPECPTYRNLAKGEIVGADAACS